MADPKLRLAENVEGEFYVDSSCIDCDACRQMAPASFRDHGGQSSVYQQPRNAEEERLAEMALVACPTASIGTESKRNLKAAVAAFPQLIAGNVYFCGFTSEKSFGGWSYLITRPAERGGNVLVDSPRFSQPLVRRMYEMGGVATMFLTHQDDIADHARYAAEFGCRRIMHADDGAGRRGIEQVIEGEDEVRLDDSTGDDHLIAIPTPGHTRGHMVLLYGKKFLFTGDHLAWSPERRTLIAFRSANWYSWPEQTRSMERQLARFDDWPFEWVLPGHGRIHHAPAGEMRRHLAGCVEWMQRTR